MENRTLGGNISVHQYTCKLVQSKGNGLHSSSEKLHWFVSAGLTAIDFGT